jgi:hypothetical protein
VDQKEKSSPWYKDFASVDGVCKNSVCRKPCTSSDVCGENLFCPSTDRVCTAPATDGTKCSADITCQSEFCSAGKCSRATGMACKETEDCKGKGYWYCASSTNTCQAGVKWTGSCNSTEQCAVGCCMNRQCGVCNGAFGSKCSADSDCIKPMRCFSGFCNESNRYARAVAIATLALNVRVVPVACHPPAGPITHFAPPVPNVVQDNVELPRGLLVSSAYLLGRKKVSRQRGLQTMRSWAPLSLDRIFTSWPFPVRC